MTDPQIYPMSSGEGYAAVINGNFVSIKYWPDILGGDNNRYTAQVSAFLQDANDQYQTFDHLADAIAWAIAAAQTHQGQPRPVSRIVHWEIRHCYAITVTQTDDGQYESETFPMWWDVDPSPIRDFKKFPTQDEALQHARNSADEYQRHNDRYRRIIQEIHDALAAQTAQLANPETSA